MSVWTEGNVTVAGGTGGIGRAIALRLSRSGMNVCVTGRDPDKFKNEFHGTGISFLKTGDYSGETDVLVNCIGAPFYSRCHEVDEKLLDASYESNFRVPALITGRTLAHMRGQNRGWIITINSESGLRSNVYGALYAPYKHAMRGFTDTARRENRRTGIRVTDIYPGMVDTGLIDHMPKKPAKEILIPPENIAETVYFMLDNDVYISELNMPNMRVEWE